MWRNPQSVIDAFGLATLQLYGQNPDLYKIQFAHTAANPALDKLCHWVNRINEEYLDSGKRDKASYSKWYRRFIVEEALNIERNNQYELITEMTLYIHKAEETLGSQFTDYIAMIKSLWTVLLTQVIVLLGKETRVLVGMRYGIPTWKNVSRIQVEELKACLLGTFLASYSAMHHVGKADGWMVPTFREFDIDTYREYESEKMYLEVTRDLVETAFYRQRYILDPEGVRVKVTNARNINELYLKVHGRSGTELVDILVRAETTEGAVFFVLTEKALVEGANDMTYFCPGSYLACLAAQVYHDLVTATTISGTKVLNGVLGGAPVAFSGNESSWTVIPRKIRNVVREPRLETSRRIVTEPHRVTGHIRKAKMTDAHREALEKFERETGLAIVRFIPEGYTFVRPHISPRVSTEELVELPRFIRYRIQQSLEAALMKKELRN